ncbi:ThuA domain-containing protein [Gramella sp. GC03-9]|uniref:ThuA domain-containing protein n=1 Tax=Christiangramia oceanisediminis TaxID=2920386 RepID=A0A9X2KVP1_9FLAO|nr:ThuA domain-containing protein [Gramella oceanisediminis]MCP9199377.1 ThuA domain-containing protein [Gramella oceanisediminis]
MRIFCSLLFCLLFSLVTFAQKNVLVFHETKGYRHASIETGIQAIQQLGNEMDFKTTVSNDSRFFLENDLAQIDLIIFLSTTGDIFDKEEELVFENYIEKGGNFFGIHAAADTEYDWPFYGRLVGAYFESHPEIQPAEIEVVMPEHFTVEHLPETWKRTDEWYNYKNIRPDLHVLLKLNEESYKGGKNGEDHPIAWYQDLIGGGKAIYTGGGHTAESYSEPNFREHVKRCIDFALFQ